MQTLKTMRRTSKWERLHSQAWRWLVSNGLVPSSWPGHPRIGSVALHMTGRRSGRSRAVAVTWIEFNRQRYLVSMLGEESDWVHNVRAVGGEVVIRRGRRKPVKLHELPILERAPILQAWLGRTGFSSIPRKYLRLDRHAPLADFEKIAADYPVFRIENAHPAAENGDLKGG